MRSLGLRMEQASTTEDMVDTMVAPKWRTTRGLVIGTRSCSHQCSGGLRPLTCARMHVTRRGLGVFAAGIKTSLIA